MRSSIDERVIEIAQYIIESGSTVRDAAKKFGVSKSTVHKDVAERLPRINAALSQEAKKVLDRNKAERHIRGGQATLMKYRLQGEPSGEKAQNSSHSGKRLAKRRIMY